ncbi:MAG: hypothetical protein HeimC2_10440 [Candidatus Heimdallarchaeota archaeon LC_2]|nr:MAG: hypothetical protein HeimC2_10440 [Candidatus Heimdallarchaeota archaeon LC_2]
MRFSFFIIFQKVGEGLSPNMKICIFGMYFSPSTKFTKGVKSSGIDIFDHYGKDLEGERDNDTLLVTGFYD